MATEAHARSTFAEFTMKTVLIFVLAGALMGVIVASLVVPPALSWYTAPG